MPRRHGSHGAGGRLLGAHVRVELFAPLGTEGELRQLLLVFPRLVRVESVVVTSVVVESAVVE